ncbi:phospholipid scramblase-related protein [Geomonas agri]|uniref:phospholipid scramblase-related protein n=1 Tax=Geomonas agri TaxID=2873702 RepID=UPI001CD1CBFB|nr:phospholipid scramblase-related protein [Geomonas agri]
MLDLLLQEQSVVIKQRKELIELLSFESRNKYEILTVHGAQIGFAAEQQKGLMGTLLRQIVGHWRSFDINIYGVDRVLKFVASHPFRIFFQRLEIRDALGREIGHLERELSIFDKAFRLINSKGKNICEMRSSIFKVWTFPFMRNGVEIARITKKWGGAMTEVFLDSDTFLLEFMDRNLNGEDRVVLLNAAIMIDLLYFENNQGVDITDFLSVPGGRS